MIRKQRKECRPRSVYQYIAGDIGKSFKIKKRTIRISGRYLKNINEKKNSSCNFKRIQTIGFTTVDFNVGLRL